jgi:hypothetical protein
MTIVEKAGNLSGIRQAIFRVSLIDRGCGATILGE